MPIDLIIVNYMIIFSDEEWLSQEISLLARIIKWAKPVVRLTLLTTVLAYLLLLYLIY